MSWEARSQNPNRGGVSRSGFTSESRMADADVSFDLSPAWCLAVPVAVVAGLVVKAVLL